jgi:hypothetical protein
MQQQKMVLPAPGWDLADILIIAGVLCMVGALTYIMVKKLQPETVAIAVE